MRHYIVSLIAAASSIAFFLFTPGSDRSSLSASPPSPDSTGQSSYHVLLASIGERRLELADAFTRAQGTLSKDSILNRARQTFIESIADSIAPRWFGTTWEFYGTTEKPREGSIACGYFVSTLLRDAGLKVERMKMAQQASERIVETLAREKEIKRFRNVPLDTFVTAVGLLGEGLYVVGLDYHVGYLHHNGTEVRFIHSSYIDPKCVLSEPAKRSAILASSKYRVIGKISANDEVIRKWLMGTTVKTAG